VFVCVHPRESNHATMGAWEKYSFVWSETSDKTHRPSPFPPLPSQLALSLRELCTKPLYAAWLGIDAFNTIRDWRSSVGVFREMLAAGERRTPGLGPPHPRKLAQPTHAHTNTGLHVSHCREGSLLPDVMVGYVASGPDEAP
jgi:hypothetical protein